MSHKVDLHLRSLLARAEIRAMIWTSLLYVSRKQKVKLLYLQSWKKLSRSNQEQKRRCCSFSDLSKQHCNHLAWQEDKGSWHFQRFSRFHLSTDRDSGKLQASWTWGGRTALFSHKLQQLCSQLTRKSGAEIGLRKLTELHKVFLKNPRECFFA